MPPGPGPAQVTPELAAAQLVADVWQGATEGEAEQAMILEDESEMSSVVTELMMVTVALELMKRSLPWKKGRKGKKHRGRRRRRETTKRPPQPKHMSERGWKKKNKQPCILF